MWCAHGMEEPMRGLGMVFLTGAAAIVVILALNRRGRGWTPAEGAPHPA